MADDKPKPKSKPKRKRRRRRPRRPRLPKFDLRKAMFVLPNLFTVSSIFCGVYAIQLVSDDPGPVRLYQATIAVFFGFFFDMVDGRVARLTKTQSDFGVQMDSLADLVTFGVAPAMIVHAWGLSQLGLLGVFGAFVLVACGAIRLARFNVLSSRSDGRTGAHFIGLPIPAAAAVLMSLVMFHQRTFAVPPVHPVNILVLLLVLSYLMVSNVRYRSFKTIRPTAKTLAVLGGFAAVVSIVALLIGPTFALFAVVCGYVAVGLVEEVVFFRRRRREDTKPQAPEEQPKPVEPPANTEG